MSFPSGTLRQRFPLALFLLLYLCFSLLTFRDYGCTWDEQDVYRAGAATFDYLLNGTPPQYFEPDHAYPYSFLLGPLASSEDYDLLHLLNLLFTGLLFAGLYEVLYRQTGRPWLSLSGPLFLFFTPQFLGSVPGNPKDIPFAIFYFLSLIALVLGEKLRYRWVLLGTLFGFAMASRIVGFTLLPLLVLYDLHSGSAGPAPRARSKWGTVFSSKLPEWAGVLVLSQTVLAVLWPFVGLGYLQRLPKVLALSAKFPPRFEFLFMGGTSDSISYPWTYLPVMLGVTTPLFLLVLSVASVLLVRTWRTNRLFTLMGSAFLLNFLLYTLMHPAVYDGLRHFLFLLPILATLAALGFIETAKNGFFYREAAKSAKKTQARMGKKKVDEPFAFLRELRGFAVKMLPLLVLTGVGMTVVQMVKLHPYEYLYYNELVGGARGAYGKYETDYWVVGMREAVEWLKKNEIKDPKRTYLVQAHGKPFQSEHWFLSNMKRVKEGEAADYSLVMTRAGIKPSLKDRSKVIHLVERDGFPLVFILKMR